MNDITGAEEVELQIRDDGQVIWVNTENGCVLRICQIKHLSIVDGRPKKDISIFGLGRTEIEKIKERIAWCPDCNDSLETKEIWRKDEKYGKIIDHHEYYCFGCDKTFELKEKSYP